MTKILFHRGIKLLVYPSYDGVRNWAAFPDGGTTLGGCSAPAADADTFANAVVDAEQAIDAWLARHATPDRRTQPN